MSFAYITKGYSHGLCKLIKQNFKNVDSSFYLIVQLCIIFVLEIDMSKIELVASRPQRRMLIANNLVMKFKPSLWWRTITKYIVILTRLFQNSILLISCFSECRFFIVIVLINVFIQILHSSFKGRFLIATYKHTSTRQYWPILLSYFNIVKSDITSIVEMWYYTRGSTSFVCV